MKIKHFNYKQRNAKYAKYFFFELSCSSLLVAELTSVPAVPLLTVADHWIVVPHTNDEKSSPNRPKSRSCKQFGFTNSTVVCTYKTTLCVCFV
jgi:hypothetical protein